MRYRNKSRNPLIRIMILLIKITGILLAIFLILMVVASVFKVKDVIVDPGMHYTEAEIKDFMFSDKTDRISFVLYIKQKMSGQNQIPFVEKVDIKIIDKNTVHLTVYDKLVIGCVEFMGSYMYFDLDGRIVESSEKRIEGIPIITGLKFDKIVLFETLEVQKNTMFDVIMNITKAINRNDFVVDQVNFLPNFEVELECEGHIFEIGKHDFYDEQIAELNDILKMLGDVKCRVNIKELRNGQEFYTAIPIN